MARQTKRVDLERFRAEIKRNSQEFLATFSRHDPLLEPLLRFHSLSDGLLERALAARLGINQGAVERLSYYSRLSLLRGLLQPEAYNALVELNKVRNECAHDHDRRITEGDIDRVGLKLGTDYEVFKKQHAVEPPVLLLHLLGELYPAVLHLAMWEELPETPAHDE